MAQKIQSPCCSQFSKLAVNYIDLTTTDDHQLRLLSNLLLCISDLDLLPPETLREIGHSIAGFLDRKLAREHYLFGRSTKTSDIDPIDLSAEIQRIRSRLKK